MIDTPVLNTASGKPPVPAHIQTLLCVPCWNSLFSYTSFKIALHPNILYDPVQAGSSVKDLLLTGLLPSDSVEQNFIQTLLCFPFWKALRSRLENSPPIIKALSVPDTGFCGFTYTTQTWDEIVHGEDHGCNWCDFLWGDILEYRRKCRDQSKRTEEAPAGDDRWTVTVRFEKRKEPPHQMILGLYIGEDMFPCIYEVHTRPDDNSASIVPGRNVVWNVSSPECFQLAIDCLEDCSINHPNCPRPQPTTRLPTRVVDCLNPEKPKLLASGELEAPYVALSYVWGQAQPHSTSTINIETYLSDKGIDLAVLPKTIQDAITCTHSLGLRYLWTDTLCIIQDSPEDKNHEISKMCDIYNHAYVTIIAACARKAGDGFLHNRKNPVTMELPFWCPDGKLGIVSVREQMYAPRDDPVNQRAWCFQEQLLSPRALVYASHTLQYHCQAGTKNVGNANNYLALESTDRFKLPDLKAPESVGQQWELWRQWKTIVAEYSNRSLTSSMDKLVALSGVAQYFSQSWGRNSAETAYLAGLWRHTLSQDILWYKKDSSVRFPPPISYRAPSWSWAATDGGVADHGWPGIVEPSWTVRRCEVTQRIPNLDFSEVSDGELEVEAVMRCVSWDAPGLDSSDVPLYEFNPGSGGLQQTIGFVYLDYSEADLEQAGTREGFALIVGSVNRKVLHNLIGLVVVPVAGAGSVVGKADTTTLPRYRRLGLFDVHEKLSPDQELAGDDEPYCDVENWLKTSPQVVVLV